MSSDRASCEAVRLAPKLAPLRLPKTARELSAGLSSSAGDSSSMVWTAPVDALVAGIASSPRSSFMVSGATVGVSGPVTKGATLLATKAEISSRGSIVLGISIAGTSTLGISREGAMGACRIGTAGRDKRLDVPDLIVAVEEAAGCTSSCVPIHTNGVCCLLTGGSDGGATCGACATGATNTGAGGGGGGGTKVGGASGATWLAPAIGADGTTGTTGGTTGAVTCGTACTGAGGGGGTTAGFCGGTTG